jgi:hypothetical protein
MNEPRSPTIKLSKSLPKNKGRFLIQTRVHLYPAKQWSEKFAPSSPKRKDCIFLLDGVQFIPPNSSKTESFYRIKVNDTWYAPNGKQYEFYKESVAYRLLEEL